MNADPEAAIAPPSPADYDFVLPDEAIAQHPPEARDGARMLCLARRSGATRHGQVRALAEELRPGDLLVVNATRVRPARLRGRKQTGGAAEALLLGPVDESGAFRALIKCRGRLRVRQAFIFERAGMSLAAEIEALGEDGIVTLRFDAGVDPYALGEAPLPPYIRRSEAVADDGERYQTVFAREPGAVAAPTAGLHLSEALLAEIAARGVERAELVLHVGIGTFRPLCAEALARGELHAEAYTLPEETAEAIARTRARGGRVVAVGTTTTRVLEHCAEDDGRARAGSGETRLFLRPGSRFRVVDALLTNFHLPRSSLLMLVAAFAGREPVLAAYREAVAEGYRFYSYGDCMWIA